MTVFLVRDYIHKFDYNNDYSTTDQNLFKTCHFFTVKLWLVKTNKNC